MGTRSGRRTRSTSSSDPPLDLHGPAERRDWAALPRDVLCVILCLVPQADILRGAALTCTSWRRLALDEPLLWRRIDLATDKDEDGDPPARREARACAAVRRSAGRCESYRGRANRDFLLFLANSAPWLRSLHVTCRLDMRGGENFMARVAKRLPLLEQLVLSEGQIEAPTGRLPGQPKFLYCTRLFMSIFVPSPDFCATESQNESEVADD